MTRQEAEKALALLGPKVADLLGFELVAGTDAHMVRMVMPVGAFLFFSVGWKGGGYGTGHVSGQWPLDGQRRLVESNPIYKDKLPSINVSLERGADAIARDIERRFLPGYLELWNKAKERLREQEEHEDETAKNAGELAKIVGVPLSEIRDGKFSLYRSQVFPESASDARVSGESVTLNLHLDMEGARVVLMALVQAARGR